MRLDWVPFADVAAYDALCFPVPRTEFLKAWLGLPGAVGLAVVRGGRLAGFGLMRICGVGRKIGPLFADDADAARDIYRGLASEAPGEPLFLDVPDPNAAGTALAGEFGLEEVFRTVRMYRGPEPDVDVNRIFGVTSFELG